MTNKRAFWARCGFVLGLALAAASAPAQSPPLGYSVPRVDEAPAPADADRPRAQRTRARISPYLEVAQVVSADLDEGDTLTYTSVAAGVDGAVSTRRVAVSLSYRYQRNIEWGGRVGDQDVHSGVAMASVQVVPGIVQLDAGALATRTGGQGRALGVTDRDSSVEVYSAYAGPTLTTHAGPVAVNAAYRLGYVAVDDDSGGGVRDGFDSATAHVATATVGMAPGRVPVGWSASAGYARTDSSGPFDPDFEAYHARGDVVVPVSPSLALTAGVGYERIEASQRDVERDANGVPVVGPDGRVRPDPGGRRLLTYDIEGMIYDAGLIWRPSARTELQARAGHRYGGTTFVGSLTHRFSPNAGMSAAVFDGVQTFGGVIVNDLSNLSTDFEAVRDPLTGNLGGCVFGAEAGSGVCLDRSLQSIRGGSFRMRGASLVFSGDRGLWSWGAGAGYVHRRYGRVSDPVFDIFGDSDESFTLYGSLGRRLSRSSDLNFSAFANWFDTDRPDFERVFGAGATASYSRRLLFDRLRLLAALGLYHSNGGALDSNVASGLIGLRYSF